MSHRTVTPAEVRAVVQEDRDDLLDLTLLLGGMPSPHGQEIEVAREVQAWFQRHGIRTWLQPITPTSANAVGVVSGTGEGRSLIIDAHLDTGPVVPADAPERIHRIHQAWIEDGMLYGYGAINDKAQVAAAMLAARALKKAGVRLAGDLIVAAVAFETGAPSYGDNQGIDHPGEGFGTWWLFNRGVTADYALIGETSGFGLITAECGELGLEVTLEGRKVYTPRIERGASPAEHPTSVGKMPEVVRAIEAWAVEYESAETMTFAGGTIVPKAQIISVEARLARTSIQVDVRLVPGANPRAVQRSMEQHLRATGVEVSVEPFQWSRGYIAEGAEALIEAVTSAHGEVLGGQPSIPPVAEMSMWRDLNMFNEVGIPSICYGPPRQSERLSDAHDRAMKVDDLVAATEVYALTALELCGQAGAPGLAGA